MWGPGPRPNHIHAQTFGLFSVYLGPHDVLPKWSKLISKVDFGYQLAPWLGYQSKHLHMASPYGLFISSQHVDYVQRTSCIACYAPALEVQ